MKLLSSLFSEIKYFILSPIITIILIIHSVGVDSSHADSSNMFFIARREVSNPSIIMIVIDTLRYDHLSDAGYERDTSPNLSEFANAAVVFSYAFSSAPWTLPSFTSILLGKHAFNHNMNKVPVHGETVDGTMLSQKIKEAGYKTVSIQTNLFSQYFDTNFEENYHFWNDDVFYQDAQAIDMALAWIGMDSNIDNSFFLFAGLFSPHMKYQANNGYLENFVMDNLYKSQSPVTVNITGITDNALFYSDLSSTMQEMLGTPKNPSGYYQDSRLYVAAYDSEIKYSDFQVGRLLNELKSKNLYDDAIVIITADHGENMVDHLNYFSHGNNLFNSLLHVPLMIKFPGQKTRIDITTNVRTIDILPTVFDYLSLDAGVIDGKSLIPVINQCYINNLFNSRFHGTGLRKFPKQKPRYIKIGERPVISYWEDGLSDKYVSIVRGDYKLIKTPNGDYLYNFKEDPYEQFDVSDQEKGLLIKLNNVLSRHYPYFEAQ